MLFWSDRVPGDMLQWEGQFKKKTDGIPTTLMSINILLTWVGWGFVPAIVYQTHH